MMTVRNCGWFILDLYSGEGEAQTTDADIELSDHICIDMNTADHQDISINDDHKNLNVSASSVYSEDIEVSKTIHLDIGKVSLFEGDD